MQLQELLASNLFGVRNSQTNTLENLSQNSSNTSIPGQNPFLLLKENSLFNPSQFYDQHNNVSMSLLDALHSLAPPVNASNPFNFPQNPTPPATNPMTELNALIEEFVNQKMVNNPYQTTLALSLLMNQATNTNQHNLPKLETLSSGDFGMFANNTSNQFGNLNSNNYNDADTLRYLMGFDTLNQNLVKKSSDFSSMTMSGMNSYSKGLGDLFLSHKGSKKSNPNPTTVNLDEFPSIMPGKTNVDAVTLANVKFEEDHAPIVPGLEFSKTTNSLANDLIKALNGLQSADWRLNDSTKETVLPPMQFDLFSHSQSAKQSILESSLQMRYPLSLSLFSEPSGMVGAYTREERTEKIIRYKKKIMKWRNKHPVSRSFNGRSKTAVNKPRVKGKFVSKSAIDMDLKTEK